MNKTFHAGDPDYNSCVGTNGYVDIVTYSDGYNEAVKVLMSKIAENRYFLDLLIYPLLFSARHRIELLLKSLIIKMASIKQVFDPNYSYKTLAVHEISTLWAKVSELSKSDVRYESLIVACNEIINDFSQIDDSGETFRYPFENNGNRHLENIGCIDVQAFNARYEMLNDALEQLDALSDILVEEYQQKSVIMNLSRSQIAEISRDLLDISKWSDPEFDENRKSIMKKHSISSNTLSKVVNFIKTHREFSINIGNEIPLDDITTTDIQVYLDAFDSFREKIKTEQYHKVMDDHISILIAGLNDKSIATLSALYEIGYFDLYSEQFDSAYSSAMSEQHKDVLIRFNLLESGLAKEKIHKGLISTGQKTLINSVAPSRWKLLS